MKDRHGNEVNIGDIVRVLEIAPEFLAVLPEEEKVHIEAMLNREFAIDEFPEQGKVGVSISVDEGNGHTFFAGLYMLSHEFELVRKASQ